jgi:hypothetical protein
MLIVPASARAQQPTSREVPITSPPPNVIVPNYNGIPIGPFGGLAGSAYIARGGRYVGNYQFTTVSWGSGLDAVYTLINAV